MTKYILHGGSSSRPTEGNSKFFAEMTTGLLNPVTILCVYFSRPKEEWDNLIAHDKGHFSSASHTRVMNFVLASEDTKIFREQIKTSDVVYMRGGKTDMLLGSLKPIENFGSLLKGKVIGGSSAGACVLSTHFHTGTEGSRVRDGLGILRIKVFVHYIEEKRSDLQELENRGERLPIYKIPEEKFFVIKQ